MIHSKLSRGRVRAALAATVTAALSVTLFAPSAGAATRALAAPAAAAVGPAEATDQRARLQQLLDAEHAAGMPGVFAQVRDGRRAWNLAAGVADLDTGQPVRPWFRQRVGSITKTFVATTVLQLVGEHRVRLDAPIARYLPGLVPGTLGQQVTVQMLLNHTSGLGDYDDVLLSGPDAVVGLQFQTVTPQELIRVGLSQPPTNAPGQRWSYSNTNYIILGLLIERLTGHRYAAEVNRRIIGPLRLRDTYFPGNDPYIRGPHSKAYVQWTDGGLRDFSDFNMSWGWAAGELISTMADLNRFYRALLTGRLLRRDLLAQMQTTVPFEPSMPQLGGYGLGLYWLALPCGKAWGHNGGVVGYTTDSYHSADARQQVSVAQNANNAPLDQAYEVHNTFLATALCGPQPTTSGTAVQQQSLTTLLARIR
jgi:D-alanyl-D-alanine carboxypeptidase